MKEGGELHTHYGCTYTCYGYAHYTYTCYGYAHYRPLLPTPPQVARRS
jgi:hypothetical protein